MEHYIELTDGTRKLICKNLQHIKHFIFSGLE
jgi:hypothetical protein